jgi:hypothetical protein
VQTYARVGLPPITTRTRWRFGSKRRFVATIEWLRLLPNPGFLLQIAQTLDTVARIAEDYGASARGPRRVRFGHGCPDCRAARN